MTSCLLSALLGAFVLAPVGRVLREIVGALRHETWRGEMSEDSGVVAHIVISDPEAHRELIKLCHKWHNKIPNAMFIDCEQSLFSYRQEQVAEHRRLRSTQWHD